MQLWIKFICTEDNWCHEQTWRWPIPRVGDTIETPDGEREVKHVHWILDGTGEPSVAVSCR